MEDSILLSVKKVLGVDSSYDVFDPDIIMHINSVFMTLQQLGVGPDDGFSIEDDTATWSDFFGTGRRYNAVQSYVYLRVRLLFDPPGTPYLIEAMKAQMAEMEWRLEVARTPAIPLYPLPLPDTPENTTNPNWADTSIV